MSVKHKMPIWVNEDVHRNIKAAAAREGKKLNEYMKVLSDRVEKENETNKKWKFI